MKIGKLSILLSLIATVYLRCICPGYRYNPVCGRNGKTYYNYCLMKCDEIKLASFGTCNNCDCPDIV